MIQDIGNKVTLDNGKRNWIDQNNVVFGYDGYTQSCEHWGWGVYGPESKIKWYDEPTDLPYHFDFAKGAIVDVKEPFFWNYEGKQPEITNVVQVTLVHDDDPNDTLIFECFCCHNGFYYHDFSFEKLKKEKENN